MNSGVQLTTHPEGSGEGVLEVVADGQEKWLSARDHGHAGRQVTHHVVGSQVHAVDVGVQGKVLGRRDKIM